MTSREREAARRAPSPSPPAAHVPTRSTPPGCSRSRRLRRLRRHLRPTTRPSGIRPTSRPRARASSSSTRATSSSRRRTCRWATLTVNVRNSEQQPGRRARDAAPGSDSRHRLHGERQLHGARDNTGQRRRASPSVLPFGHATGSASTTAAAAHTAPQLHQPGGTASRPTPAQRPQPPPPGRRDPDLRHARLPAAAPSSGCVASAMIAPALRSARSDEARLHAHRAADGDEHRARPAVRGLHCCSTAPPPPRRRSPTARTPSSAAGRRWS